MFKVNKNHLIILILIVIIFSAIIATIHDSQSYFGDKSTKTTVAETAAPETTVPQITVAETKAEDLITIEKCQLCIRWGIIITIRVLLIITADEQYHM